MSEAKTQYSAAAPVAVPARLHADLLKHLEWVLSTKQDIGERGQVMHLVALEADVLQELSDRLNRCKPQPHPSDPSDLSDPPGLFGALELGNRLSAVEIALDSLMSSEMPDKIRAIQARLAVIENTIPDEYVAGKPRKGE